MKAQDFQLGGMFHFGHISIGNMFLRIVCNLEAERPMLCHVLKFAAHF
jgi:hypothetical protein